MGLLKNLFLLTSFHSVKLSFIERLEWTVLVSSATAFFSKCCELCPLKAQLFYAFLPLSTPVFSSLRIRAVINILQ